MPPPRLFLAALLGLGVVLLLSLIALTRPRRSTSVRLSPARAAAVAAAAATATTTRADLPAPALPNARDLAAHLPIAPGRVFRTSSPFASEAGLAALEAVGVRTVVDLRSRAEVGASPAVTTTTTITTLPARPDRPGRDALVALAGHWHASALGRAWSQATRRRRQPASGKGGGGGGWHPPPPDPPFPVEMAATNAHHHQSFHIIRAPIQDWARYLRVFVLGHAPPPHGLAVLTAWVAARAVGARPPVPSVRARLEAATAAAGLAGMYAALLDGFGPEIVGAVRAVGACLAAGAPVAVSCKLGKDRTGLVAALLGLAAGADEGAVLADYAASAGPDTPVPPPGFEALAGAPPAALAAALDHLDAAHGGWAAYLAAHGCGPAEQAGLRRALRA
jgi:hypothetical protein